MHLSHDAFTRILTGTKNVEVRLLDQRRKKLVIGDTLLFVDKENYTQMVSAEIVGLQRFSSFAELFEVYGPKDFGHSETMTSEEFVARLHNIYYYRDEERLGVIAIKLAKKRTLFTLYKDSFLGKTRLSLLDTVDYKKLFPIKQSYGFCFNADGQFLIGRSKSSRESKWTLLGGTVEQNENPIATLHREVDEEVSASLYKPTIIAIQKIEFLEKEREPEYQLYFAVKIKKIKEPTLNLDTNEVWERKFISPDEFSKFLPWGNIGEVLVKKAVAWFKEEQGKKKRKNESS